MNVVVAGGGTAGHVFPAIAMADALRERHGATVEFLGAADGQEARLVPAAGYPFTPLRIRSAQTRVSMRSLGALRMARAAAVRCRPQVAWADVVVGIGGFASAPGAMAARRTRRPLVLIEQNSVPGVVNRIAARWARVVAVVFEATTASLPPRVRTERTGNPVRREIVAVPSRRPALIEEARRCFGLDADRRTVVVLGGSQGAQHLDEVVARAIEPLRDRRDLQLVVSTGPGRESPLEAVLPDAGDLLVRPIGFIERMDLALAVADVAVARSGAGQIAELTVCGVPAILVPYPHATENHQEANARELERLGAAEIVLDVDLTPARFVERIDALLGDPARRAAMADAAARWARPDADDRLADLVAAAAGGSV
ncbi:MAG TPA: undecaprenyldiphospho-muramoylpentapeptide beta-N-acetylglucosaminyltransferase [Actinomycetota bacterium]|nr:undecaprenyldiphospho-muramoylpentapeptide beta-N-acetylglucosaminyltransferase [Actinomycetota bacterium]